MKKYLCASVIIWSSTIAAQTTTFPYGNGLQSWGLKFKVPESELQLRLGARYQSLFTSATQENLEDGSSFTSQDFESRRIRLQMQADLGKKASFAMDLRNDGADRDDRGTQKFEIGDAFVTLPIYTPAEHTQLFLRLYRTKVDVARTQTVSSNALIFVNRTPIADEVAQFVNHNRRATNVQLQGYVNKKMSFQLAVGDGVYSQKFHDAKGNAVKSIDRQNAMIGGKVRFFPFEGMDDIAPTETYMGEGKHFSVGFGAFNTSNINFVTTNSIEGKASRNLYNAEISGHYQDWSFAGEYFKMQGVIEDHKSTTGFNRSFGEGWYVQGEKIFKPYYLAPFIRYENWNRFVKSGDYESNNTLYGVNWYADGNRMRVTLAYEVNYLGKDIEGSALKDKKIHLATMWQF